MDRDELIEMAMRALAPGSYMRCLRVGGTGAYHAAILSQGKIALAGSGTSLAAALDGLADEIRTIRDGRAA